MLDWNWFYSSAAQSIAAIVGIFAAFVITKIINNQTIFTRNCLGLRNLINISKRLVERAGQVHFSLYNNHVRHRQFAELKTRLEKETSYQSPDDYFSQFRFSKYDSKQEIIPEIEEMIKHFKDGTSLSLVNYSLISKAELDEEKQKIDSFLADVQQNMRTVSSFLDSIEGNPECSNLITFAIICTIILFIAGVIFPLSLLPFNNGGNFVLSFSIFIDSLFSLKGNILALLSIIFLSIMVIFFFVNLNLRYDSNLVHQVRSFTRFSTYSKYLQCLEENS